MNWQPIETAPKDGTHVLLRFYRGQTMHVQTGVWRPDGNDMSTAPFWEYDPRWMKGNRSRRFQPTHWLPLPGPDGYPESEAVGELAEALRRLVANCQHPGYDHDAADDKAYYEAFGHAESILAKHTEKKR